MSPVLASVPVDVEVLAEVVERHADYRVLRRMRTMNRREPFGFSAGVLRGACVDVETTGLDPLRDRIIELAVQPFETDESGRIVSTGELRSWLEDPGVPLSEQTSRITKLRNEDVRGRAIPDGEAHGILASASVIIAHNAVFDCSFVERRLPGLAGHSWACSLNGFDWAASGFEGRTLSHLCSQTGWFYEAHRAGSDVTALMHLLDHELADGATVLRRLIERERLPTWSVEIRDAPRDTVDALKNRGYRWSSDRLLWRKEVAHDRRDIELEWVTIHIYRATRAPESTKVDWTTRYSRP